MILKFENLIDVDYHCDKINRSAQKLKNEYAPIVNAAQYLQALFDFFLDDIENVAHEIYGEALDEASKGLIKFSALELKESVLNGTQHFFDLYESIINGYNMGGMFREYDKLEKDRATFKIRAKQASKKQSETISSEYRRLLKKKCRASWTFWATMTAAAMSTLGVIITLVVSFVPPLKTVSVKPPLTKANINAKIDDILISGTQLAVSRCNIPKK